MKKVFRKPIALCLFIGISLFFASCKKEEIASKPEVRSETEMRYYLNEIEVSEARLIYDEDHAFVVELRNRPAGPNSRSTVNEKRVFTSKELYVEFGEQNGLKFKEQLEFEKIMQDMATQAGLLDENNETDVIPEWYIEREKVVYDSLFNNNTNHTARMLASAFVALYDNHDAQGSSIVMVGTYPVMPTGWKDKVSSIKFFGFAGGVHLYKRTFYRSKINTYYDWGLYTINLYSSENNKMRSGIRFL
jgi:hypothetical protein